MMIQRKKWVARVSTFAVTAVVVAFIATPKASAIVTPGFDFEVIANTDIDGDDRWEDTVGTSGFDFDLAASVTRVTGVSSLSGITAAYNFVGGSTGIADGGELALSGSAGDRRSFQNAPGDWSNEDVTIEFWLSMDNTNPTPTNGQIVFEDGGGTGMGLFVDDNELRLRKAGGGGNVAYDLSAYSGDFLQAVATYDVSAGVMEFFVNGVSIGTDNPGGGDWSGGDNFGLGTRGQNNTGGIGGGQQSTESFDGQIAIFRVYRNQILTAEEVQANYQAVAVAGVPEPATATLAMLGLGGLMMRRRRAA